VIVSTGLTRARRSQAALALNPIPASKVQSVPLKFAELDKHNSGLPPVPYITGLPPVPYIRGRVRVMLDPGGNITSMKLIGGTVVNICLLF
jgi:hypothetical protein